MQSNKFPLFRRFQSGIHLSALLVFWTFGIILGTALGAACSAASLSLMRQAITVPASFVPLAVGTTLPFVITAAIVYFGVLKLLYLLGFLKGFAFGQCGMMCLVCYGTAGWLARLLIFFSQLLSISALWLIWLQICRKQERISRRGMYLLFLYLTAVVLADYFLVAPYTGRLI